MATASPSHVSKEKLADDFLSCSLCLETFKQPKVLQCQHTFCLSCLQKLGEGGLPIHHIVCPLCREQTFVPSGDLNTLKTNFIVESLLSFVLYKENSAEEGSNLEWSGQQIADHCQLCEEKKETCMFCDDCKMWLCKSCSVPHNKLPATKSHRTLAVSDIMGKAKDQLRIIEKDLSNTLGNIEGQVQAAMFDQEFLSEQATVAASSIESTCQKIVGIILDKKQHLLQEVAVNISESDTQQNLKISQLQENYKRFKRCLDFVKDVRNSTDAHHVTNMMTHVEHLRKSVADMSVTQDSVSRQEYEFRVVDSVAQVVGSSSLGSILIGHSQPHLAAEFPPDRETEGEFVHRLASNYYITGIASTCNGNILVASNCNSLKKISNRNVCEVEIRCIEKPWGVVKAPSNELIVTDCGESLGSGSVNILDHEGKFVRRIANGLSLPRGVAVDVHGRIYVCDEWDRCVYVMTFEGRIVQIIKFSWDGNFLFDAPRFITVDKDNCVYVSDGGKAVKIFNSTFNLVGTYLSPFTRSEFWDVLTDDSGTLFVLDWTHGIHAVNSQRAFQGFLKQPVNSVVVKEPTSMCVFGGSPALMVGTSNGEIIILRFIEME